jgi:hypothetical protein
MRVFPKEADDRALKYNLALAQNMLVALIEAFRVAPDDAQRLMVAKWFAASAPGMLTTVRHLGRFLDREPWHRKAPYDGRENEDIPVSDTKLPSTKEHGRAPLRSNWRTEEARLHTRLTDFYNLPPDKKREARFDAYRAAVLLDSGKAWERVLEDLPLEDRWAVDYGMAVKLDGLQYGDPDIAAKMDPQAGRWRAVMRYVMVDFNTFHRQRLKDAVMGLIYSRDQTWRWDGLLALFVFNELNKMVNPLSDKRNRELTKQRNARSLRSSVEELVQRGKRAEDAWQTIAERMKLDKGTSLERSLSPSRVYPKNSKFRR